MIVGTLQLEIFIPASDSLKAKRSVLNSVKERVRTRFNASVAEIGHLDLWQRSTLAVAVVGGAPGVVDHVLHDVLSAVEREPRLQVLDVQLRVE